MDDYLDWMMSCCVSPRRGAAISSRRLHHRRTPGRITTGRPGGWRRRLLESPRVDPFLASHTRLCRSRPSRAFMATGHGTRSPRMLRCISLPPAMPPRAVEELLGHVVEQHGARAADARLVGIGRRVEFGPDSAAGANDLIGPLQERLQRPTLRQQVSGTSVATPWRSSAPGPPPRWRGRWSGRDHPRLASGPLSPSPIATRQPSFSGRGGHRRAPTHR